MSKTTSYVKYCSSQVILLVNVFKIKKVKFCEERKKQWFF